MEFTGYVEYKKNTYTFNYKDDKLMLIITNQHKDNDSFFYYFNTSEKLDYLNGYTSDGFIISFYIDGLAHKWCGTYRCFPKLVIYSKTKGINLNQKFKTLKLTGGVLNRFYSNQNIINAKEINIFENNAIEFKPMDDTKHEENIIIDNKKAFFQISIGYPAVKYDGSFTLGDIPTIARIIFFKKRSYREIVESIITMNNLFMFCLNRRCCKFDSVSLEKENEDGKYVEIMKVYIPIVKEEASPKYMLDYLSIANRISRILRILSKVKYIIHKIPESNKEYSSITASSYTNMFSAFQSIYNYVNTINKFVCENRDFESLKIEICQELQAISDKYKGVNSKKRKYVDRYIKIIKMSNLKIEQMIINTIKKYEYIIETLPDDEYKNVMFDYESAVEEATHDRDLITHNDVFTPSSVDISVYLVMERLCYAMILDKVGLTKKETKKVIQHLSSRRVI